jgi:predicted transcriptional regulator
MSDMIRLRQQGLRKLMGDLEASIMEVVWAKEPGALVTVREVYEALLDGRKIAYTSVMTVMGNLAKKGVLAVEKSGTAYLYRAPLTQEAFTSQAVGAIVSELLSDFADPALAHFSKALEGAAVPAETLDRLRARLGEQDEP